MKDSNENINSSQNDPDKTRPHTVNSSKLIIPHNSAKELPNPSPSNFIQRNSPMLPKSIYHMDLSKEESNRLSNNTQNSNMYHLPSYTPLTPQILPKNHRRYSKKNFPSKEEVCKGNPNYSQKMNIPTYSPITQYFNMDNNIFNNDFGFQLENKNVGEQRMSQLSNSSPSVKFNCSPSYFFNNKINNDLRKSFKGVNIIEENEEDFNKNNDENEGDFLTMNIEGINQDNNFVDDENNDILTKIKDFKKKKTRDKPKLNNNNKLSKNSLNKINDNNIIDNKEDKEDITNKMEEMQLNDSLNVIKNTSEEKSEEQKNENKEIIKEDNNSYFIPKDISKNLNIYTEQSENNNKQDIIQDKEEINEDKNMYNKQNNMIINDDTKNMNYNNQLMNNNINNYMEQNNDNLKYINNMNINCTNLNINNYSNINQNIKNTNMNSNMNVNMNISNPNQQQLYYLMKYNNGQINFGNNGYNNFNNIGDGMNKMNKNILQNFYQMKGIYMNNIMNNSYFPQNNNMNPNYIFNNNINNFNNNSNNNQPKNETKKKKPKKLEISFYMDKPLSFLGENLNILSKDQGACRYIQNLIDAKPYDTLNYLYKPLCLNILKLINDPFGNYLIQKIIIYLNEEQLYEILTIISRYFSEICNNIYGTRVIQTIIDNLKTPKLANYFYQLLKPIIIHLLKELNGTFVVQKFAKMYSDYNNDISDVIVSGSHILSTHRHGCCVVQKYLELNDPYLVPKLVDKLLDKSLLLIVDQFGNYVIQTILKKNNKNYGNKLAEKIVENVVYYAKHKYSSNVVEKCFDYCDGIYLSNLINNIQKKENLLELILDEHGNYVVQKVIMLSNPIAQRQMLKLIMENIDKLKHCNHGERVINRLVVNYPFINDKNFLDDIN